MRLNAHGWLERVDDAVSLAVVKHVHALVLRARVAKHIRKVAVNGRHGLSSQRPAVSVARVPVQHSVLGLNVVLVADGDGRARVHAILAHAVAVH